MENSLISERILFARESCGLNQEEFARRLKMTKSAISGYETGRRIPPDSVLHTISLTFGFDEDWLKYGIGDPVAPNPDDALEELFKQFGCSDFERAFLFSYFSMSDKDRMTFCAYAKELVEKTVVELKRFEQSEKNPLGVSGTSENSSFIDPNADEDAYAKLAREQRRKEKKQDA